MRVARLQANDLGRAEHFFGTLLSKENVKETDKLAAAEPVKAPQVNGGSLSIRTDAKTRFSDPPAPPPQQPLPEKPDIARSHSTFDPSSPSSLKRSNTERPKSVPNVSPIRQESSSQILNLVESLASTKKEVEVQGARIRDLEEMLEKERQARALAEEVAKRLETQSSELKPNGHVEEGCILEDAFEPPTESVGKENEEPDIVDTKSISDSTLLLEKRLEKMAVEMQQMKEHMEDFKARAEVAESDRNTAQATLAQMVEKIRAEELSRRSSSTERARSPRRLDTAEKLENGTLDNLSDKSLLETAMTNGKSIGSAHKVNGLARGSLTRPPGGHDPLLYHTLPYASMLGVVMIGIAAMAYLNNLQVPKTDR
jgi:hypothetical protein